MISSPLYPMTITGLTVLRLVLPGNCVEVVDIPALLFLFIGCIVTLFMVGILLD